MLLDQSQKIADSDISVAIVIDCLRENDVTFSHIFESVGEPQDVWVECVSADTGHNSHVFRVKFHFCTDEGDRWHSVALKVPTARIFEHLARRVPQGWNEEVAREVVQGIRRQHDTECRFFHQLAHRLPAAMPRPRVFASRPWTDTQDGFVLMEDLSGGVVLTKFDTAHAGMARTVVRHLAEFHADLLAMPDGEWKDRNPRQVARFADKFATEAQNLLQLFSGTEKDRVSALLDATRPLAASDHFLQWAVASGHQELGLPTVLVHGDCWNSNLMWCADCNGIASSRLLAVLDWQCVGDGSPAHDLTSFLSNLDGADRRRQEEILFDFYVDCFRRHSSDGQVPFSATQLKRAYELQFVQRLTYTLVVTNKNLYQLREEIPNLVGRERSVKQALFDKYLLIMVHVLQDTAVLVQTELRPLVDRFGKV